MKKPIHLLFFSITTCFFWFSLFTYVPELSAFAEQLGANYKMIGVITASYGFSQMLIRIPLGILSDKLNQRKIFVIMGTLITTIGSLISFFYPTVLSLLMTRIFAGIAASTWVAFSILFSSYYRQEEAPKSMGILNTLMSIGQLVAMITGGFMSSRFGTTYSYLLSAIGGIIALLFSLFMYENKNIQREPLTLKKAAQVIKDPTLLFVSFLAILCQFLVFATLYSFTPLVAKNIGASSVELGTLSMIGLLPGVIISTVAGTLFVDLWGERKTMIYGFLLMSSVTIITPYMPNLIFLYIIQFITGAGRFMVFPLLMSTGIKHIEEEKRATAMGIFQAIYSIGMLLGPLFIGFIGDTFGLKIGFIITGLIGLISIVSLVKAKSIVIEPQISA